MSEIDSNKNGVVKEVFSIEAGCSNQLQLAQGHKP